MKNHSARCSFLATLALIFLCTAANAEEGMYPVHDLAKLPLRDKGLQLTAQEIFNPDGQTTCLIDGICKVNGCTGSFVSPNGLIITNHHCAYRAIQSLSSADNDYLRDGFVAQSYRDELPAKGYTVRITESFEDVSERVLDAVNAEMGFAERAKAIEQRQKEIEQRAEQSRPGMRAEVSEMFQGKTYFLFYYTYIKDVRLVFAPPAAVGNFGGDIDNWEWPRHTGDFSFMRAYVAPDGSTAEYAPENFPYQPQRHIRVAAEGVRDGDLVFLLGYPGRTARHKTSHFLDYEQNVRLPFVVDLYQWQINTMEEAGAEDRAVALKHSSRTKSLANVEKRSRGQLKGLRRAKIADTRRAQEAKLQAFIEADPQRKEKYGDVLAEIGAAYAEISATAEHNLTWSNLRNACRSLAIAYTLYDAATERQKPDLEREPPFMERNFDQTAKRLMLSVKDLHVETDKKMLFEMHRRIQQLHPANHDAEEEFALNAAGASIEESIDDWYRRSRIGDSAFVEQCLTMTPEELVNTQEPFLEVIARLYPKYMLMREEGKRRSGQLDQLYGQLLEAKRSFLKDQFVPDANATLRFTYGFVRGYSPEDAVIKTPITTLQGVVDKTTGQSPFITPQKILDMHAARDFGSFAHPDMDDVAVGILYSTDTTGGNSGSPIMNARGELVGVNFDRAFEATINDFAWNESYSRSIGVDIRYALWITGRVYQANWLLDEMGL